LKGSALILMDEPPMHARELRQNGSRFTAEIPTGKLSSFTWIKPRSQTEVVWIKKKESRARFADPDSPEA
jgi:hypothetical protein